MSNHDGGKGDAPRPLGVSMEEFDRNFDLIFGKKDKTKTDSSIEIKVEATNDDQQITINKTWEF
jgi:uncharacterized protein (DUF1810 family)